MASKWPLIPMWCFKRVSEVWSNLLFDHIEKVIIFGPFSYFGLKMASSDLGGQIWPHTVPIIWVQGTFYVLWHTPQIRFLLWLFEDSNQKWPLMASKWPLIPMWFFKRVSEVWSNLLFDHIEKVIIFGPFSYFGLKMASNDLGGRIWPHPVPIIWGQGTFFV